MGFLEGLGSVLSAIGEATLDSQTNNAIYREIEILSREMSETPIGSYRRKEVLIRLDRAIRNASEFEKRLIGKK